MSRDNIVFSNTPIGYYTTLCNKQHSQFIKLDTGTSITIMNHTALSSLVSIDTDTLKDVLSYINAPRTEFYGVNSSSFDACLYRLTNVEINNVQIKQFFFAVCADTPRGEPHPKILLGKDFIDCTSITKDINSHMILIPDFNLLATQAEKRVLSLFNASISQVPTLDFLTDVLPNHGIYVSAYISHVLERLEHPELLAKCLSIPYTGYDIHRINASVDAIIKMYS